MPAYNGLYGRLCRANLPRNHIQFMRIIVAGGEFRFVANA
jgi:hypothetical protein